MSSRRFLSTYTEGWGMFLSFMTAPLKRNGEERRHRERVDDDELLAKEQPPAFQPRAVLVAPHAEEAGLAFEIGLVDGKVRVQTAHAVTVGLEAQVADEMPTIVQVVLVRGAQRGHPVAQHVLVGAEHDRRGHAEIDVLARQDPVAAVLGEKL